MTTLKIQSSLLFCGRPGDPRLGEIANITDSREMKQDLRGSIAILGAPDDLGVRLNRGREGARGGPEALRGSLYRFAVPDDKWWSKNRLIDIGNIPVTDNISKNHQHAYDVAAMVGASGATMVAIGGGHDYAAPHFLGFFSGIAKTEKSKRFGLINVDPHLDVRELENGLPNSGTAFRQILESGMIKGKNLVQFGARIGRNSADHFKFCKQKGVKLILFDEVQKGSSSAKKFTSALNALTKRVDKVGVTIDIDSCSEVEGASAAAVLGFSASELCQFAFIAGSNKKVAAFELAELAPSLDGSQRSARIGAEIVFHFMMGVAKR